VSTIEKDAQVSWQPFVGIPIGVECVSKSTNVADASLVKTLEPLFAWQAGRYQPSDYCNNHDD
jgi:hypothetical protein